MKKCYCIVVLAVILSCNNNEKKTGDDMSGTKDTATHTYPANTDPGNIAYGKHEPLTDDAEAEKIKRRELIYMGIDSTYYAIHQIEEIKDEIGEESSVNLSVSERNIKSKVIQKLNILQNSLARQVDSALLINLKIHTKQLADINNSITENVVHLKDISAKLAKAANIMNRITGVLSFCVSKGLIKPPTPPGSTATAVKSTVK
jgi:hypothetical protein